MKNSTFIIILLSVALVSVCYKWVSSVGESPAMKQNPETALENIMTRTSVRAYSEMMVDDGKIDTLLRAAMAAPTAGNKQPWRFVVVRDKAMLDSISNNFHTMKMAKDASVAVVVCGDPTATFEGEGREFWVQDVSAATENLLLAANAQGLGAVWCGIYPIKKRVEKFSQMLSLPEEIIPMACICIGYPLGENPPKDKWRPEYVHYETWGGKQG